MFLLMSVLGLVIWKSTASYLAAFTLTPLVWVSTLYLLNMIGVPFYFHFIPDVIGCAWLVYASFSQIRRKPGFRARLLEWVSKKKWELFLGSLSFLITNYIFYTTYLLNTHDPIAVPTYAAFFVETRGIPLTNEPLGPGPFIYPPGLSLLMMPFYAYLGNVEFLRFFALFSIMAVAATPLTWAYFLRQVLPKFAPFWLLIITMMIGFYFVDRTLIYALPQAGKNSQLVASCIFPLVCSYLVSIKQLRAKDIVIGSLAVLGLILCHYSAVYMFVAALFVFAVVKLVKGQWPTVFAIALSGAIAALLFLPHYMKAQSVATQLSATENRFAIEAFLHFILAREDSILSIFKGFPFKGATLVGGLVLGALFSAIAGSRSTKYQDLWIVFLSLLFALFFSLCLAWGFLPRVSLTPDYVRWYLFNFSSAAFGLIIALVLQPFSMRFPRGKFVIMTFFLLVVCRQFYMGRDFVKAHHFVDSGRFTYRSINQADKVLDAVTKNESCFIYSKVTWVTNTHASQVQRPLDYSYVLSRCVSANGSWLAPPWRDSRNLGMFPSEQELIEKLNTYKHVLIVAPQEELQSRAADYSKVRLDEFQDQINGWPVWVVSATTKPQLD